MDIRSTFGPKITSIKYSMNRDIISCMNHLKKGNVCAIPTDTIYGLAVDATNKSALDKLSIIKKRPIEKKYVLQFPSVEKTLPYIQDPAPELEKILKTYWPGEITFILNKNKHKQLPYIEETLAVRIPDQPLTLELLENYPNPLAVTSINISGEAESVNMDDIPEAIRKKIDFILPFKGSLSGKASTIVNITTSTPNIIRQGNCIFTI